jgi:hypothetical protein
VSNVFKSTGTLFFPVPQALISSGDLGKLSAGAIKLYLFLLFAAQKWTRVELEISNAEIREQAALSPNTIRRARTELKEVGLVDLKHVSGGRYTYVILDPVTRSPLPRPRALLRGNSPSTPSAPSTSETSTCASPAWSEFGK